ncbi:MAG TPA: type II toxin-antitoxin system HicA family toxin [Proteobacteria bacterium]|nr:type II toxin-antitoxin system HicA family toxin [Pseudomonadota bacterium]
MKYRELAKKLRGFGCYEVQRRGGGSHRKWFNPESGKGTVIPDWGDKDLKHGTIKAILKQLGINPDKLSLPN